MSEVTRKTLLRLVALVGLLALFPLAILVLRSMPPLSVEDELAGFEAHLSGVVGAGPCGISVTLRLDHPADAAFTISSVGLSVLEDGEEQLTRLESGTTLEARTDRSEEGRTLVGPFCLDVPESPAERLLMVTTRVDEPASGSTRSLLREALIQGREFEVIDPEGAQRPDFLQRAAPPDEPPRSAP